MKKLIIFLLIIAIGWYGNQKYRAHHGAEDADEAPEALLESQAASSTNAQSKFHCDGREYCSQMTSCEEATFFIQHCPNAKMDGNNDGVPCEKQWCR